MADYNKPLTAEEEEEAKRLQRIAERAEQKALLLQQQQNGNGHKPCSSTDINHKSSSTSSSSSSFSASNGTTNGNGSTTSATKFLSKQEREKVALERLELKRKEQEERAKEAEMAHNRFITGRALEDKKRQERLLYEKEIQEKQKRLKEDNKEEKEMENELKSIREHYLGQVEKKRKISKPSEKFQKIFQFDWEADDDTSKNDINPLYANRVKINTLFGRGYMAGTDQREQRKGSNFLLSLSEKRLLEMKQAEEMNENISEQEKYQRNQTRIQANENLKRQHLELTSGIVNGSIGSSGSSSSSYSNSSAMNLTGGSSGTSGSGSMTQYKSAYDKQFNSHWSEKELKDMTDRDWRIFREDFDIRVQGGRATFPLRFWSEGHFPSQVMKAIEDAGYEKPSPIQRQAIPIGQARRDIIGIAETGSGKTAAFVIPLLCYLLSVPASHLTRVNDQGPLAIIMAPTRELAQQIETECIKLAKYTEFITANVVGGQSIEEQGFKLRKGVHIVIGTPGRLCDCLQNNYLVLNQCNYVVLDEADRMVDMGFEPQVVEVLDAMGGLLKDEDEDQAEQQLAVVQSQLKLQQSQQQGAVSSSSSRNSNNSSSSSDMIVAADNSRSSSTATTTPTETVIYRVTAMFSATMPIEVERIARTYLRHPVMIKIGDEETGKNKRIEQRVYFITEGQKKSKLLEEIRRLGNKEKAIVFVNAKKQGDSIGRYLDGLNIHSGVLHGGRSQDQREETLEQFRKGDIKILVATDVAGRGLDIADVTHVINYEVPSKIDNYCHRIGRTGRAGKFGIAISLITDADTDIMYSLKEYLESTNAAVPQQLSRHPAAQAPVGARDDKGNIMGQKKDKVQYSKK